MDVWAWVNELTRRLRDEGHARLATLIDRLPDEVVNDRHERVDATYAEALAQARALELPWLEVFVRHWWLQSRVLHRMDATALGEAVSLVEFAHREETARCPQGVCAVQDLASCYGFVDGPGFADERHRVAQETLARIDPSWPCFTCLSSEQASAMRDRGEVEASLAFVDGQIARLVERGEADAAFDFPRDRLEPLVALGRLDEALAFVLEDERRGRGDEHHRLSRRLDRARVLARLGRCDEAQAHLPDAREVAPTPVLYELWVDAATQLVARGALPNDVELGRTLQRFVARLERQGVGRTTLELAERQGRLALERFAPHVARRALATMERSLAVLHRPLDALDRVQRLRAAIDAHPSASPPEHATPDELLDELRAGEGRNPEADLLVLERAEARFPGHAAITLALVDCAQALGFTEEARVKLEGFHAQTGDVDALLRLAQHVIGADEGAVRRLAEGHRARAADAASRALADWILARDAHARGRWGDALALLERVMEARPMSVAAKVMFAECARKTGDLDRALGRLDEVVAHVGEAGPHDWDRMLAATLAGDPTRLLDSARRLGFALEGEGPVFGDWELCKVRYADEHGAPQDVWAQRVGPVTARIVALARPPREQRYDDVVAFDAMPLNPGAPKDTDRKDHVWTYAHVRTLRAGGFRSFEVEGPHPGEAAWDGLERQLRALGCVLHVLSDEDYTVGDDELPGVFALLGVPSERSSSVIHATLDETTASFGRPLSWPELAREAAEDAARGSPPTGSDGRET